MPPASVAIESLFTKWYGQKPDQIEFIPQSGSDRRYFRLYVPGSTVIATHGLNIAENEVFVYFSGHFRSAGLPVPEILALSDDKTVYLQEDLGKESLLNRLEEKGLVDEVYGLFRETLQLLARLQIRGDRQLDYSRCLTNHEFGKQAILADLLYFKYYFLDALQKPYNKQKLLDDFEALSVYLTQTEYKFFMFRDFQSRNVMLSPGKGIRFIDYQGGMKGAPHYDVASMLWQAKANLPDDWKQRLLTDYLNAFENEIGQPVNRLLFESQYHGYVLIRLLQVLGAYGFRGLFERKAHFLTSIPQALNNLKGYIDRYAPGLALPEFRKVLETCVSEEVLQRFTPVTATAETPLVVNIHSFSYKKGIPSDNSGNGGGYVFDCRGILNPGRLEAYQTLTGRDKEVKDFLEQQTRMPEFLNSMFDLVDITVENYIRRGFNSLTVSFGCTGGQHRSVYAADALARHLRNKYKVNIALTHREQESKNWVNTPGNA